VRPSMAVRRKNLTVDPTGGVLGRDSWRGVNAALWDGTGRPATRWWQAAGRGGAVWWRRRLGAGAVVAVGRQGGVSSRARVVPLEQ
jgi:hypothetical protein